MMHQHPPVRMYTSEVCALAKWSQSKLNALRRQNRFPDPVDRGREAIYDGQAVYRALGLLNNEMEKTAEQALRDALDSL